MSLAVSSPFGSMAAAAALKAERGLPEGFSAGRALVDGRRMHALVTGAGSPLVLVHGLLGTATAWVPAMRHLGQRHRTYAVDALGMGGSERVPGLDASLEASAHRFARWMDAMELQQADVLATSHGGAVSMYFAALYPGRVRRLVLHAPANPFCVHSRPQISLACTRLGALLARVIPFSPRSLHLAALRRMYGDPERIRPGSLATYVESLRVPGTVEYVLSVLRSWKRDMAALDGMLERLRGGNTLLLWGQLDRAVSIQSAHRLGHALRAPLMLLPGLGHLPFEESPETFAACVLRFLHPEPVPPQCSDSLAFRA